MPIDRHRSPRTEANPWQEPSSATVLLPFAASRPVRRVAAFRRWLTARQVAGVLALCAVLLWRPVEAQQISLQRYGKADGLVNQNPSSLLQDRDDFRWVCTENGLYRYDGNRLRRFGEDNGRGGWLAQPVLSTEQRAGTPDLARLVSANQEADGRLWLGCGEAICSVDAQGVRRWGTADGVPDDEWAAFLCDSAGVLWARGRHGVLALPAGGQRFAPQSVPNAALRTFDDASVLAESADGSIVLRTDQGVARWQLGQWSEWTVGNGLPSPDVSTVLFDREGSLWLGVGGLGLSRWLG